MLGTRHKLRIAGVAGIAALALAAAGCGSSGSSSGSSSTGAAIKGGIATAALPPNTTPNWIWPYTPITNASVYNSQQFQWLMYRPLYMFGNNTGTDVNVNYALSPADAPVYSKGGKTVTITMKGWKWSDGETVDAQDVVFWLNMMKAEKANFYGYAPGLLPDNMVSASASGNTVTMQLNEAYSSIWFTYNQLAEITPMPEAWDVTKVGAAAGSGGCAKSVTNCAAVYNFLLAQNKDTSTYATSPIWSVVDGPWKLSSFSSTGNDSFVPNAKYSGSPKPKIAGFKFVPYTSDTAEYSALKSPSSAPSIGYIPPQDLPQKPAGSAVPATDPLGSSYTLQPFYSYGIYYYIPNLNNPTLGTTFQQLYVRQALAYVNDQVGEDNTIFKGYSAPTSGGVPTTPANQWEPTIQKANDAAGPYTFDPAKAKALLTSHGWTENSSKVMVCTKPGTAANECGAGVKAGTVLSWTLDWATGQATIQSEVQILKSDAAQAGIDINLVGQSFDTVIGESAPCKPGPKCTWDALYFGGWNFDGPGYEPTGEPLFQTGAGSNSGSYSNPTMDKLINETHTSSSLAVFHQYATFVAQQLPFEWMPNAYAIQAVNSKLHNVSFSSIYTLLPEYWYFTK